MDENLHEYPQILKLKDEISGQEKRIKELEELLNLKTGEAETIRRKLQKTEKDNSKLQENLISETEKLSSEKSSMEQKMQKIIDSFNTQIEFQVQESTALMKQKSITTHKSDHQTPSLVYEDLSSKIDHHPHLINAKKRKSSNFV
ncbi:hypothetical protein AYI68_g1895 [Smittium mucronatum]|uniref:Uncharacterized protein n=1 Tax=Smittium mucronatum TaxID=133383 RepID=A0A1R0H4C6_9FUNG|nr:hypothetical protein AYI68_g1895 [Smittium mucronatum]